MDLRQIHGEGMFGPSHRSRRHEAATASHTFLRCRQSYSSESESVILHVVAAPRN